MKGTKKLALHGVSELQLPNRDVKFFPYVQTHTETSALVGSQACRVLNDTMGSPRYIQFTKCRFRTSQSP
jgi:hypothetical protein